MIIGFDASRAFVGQPTGTENYSYQLLKAMLAFDRKNFYRIYVNPNNMSSRPSQASPDAWKDLMHESLLSEIPRLLTVARNDNRENFEIKPISWPRLWTQGGLAIECITNPPDVLFVPAHTMPVIRRSNLKVVVTIHDLGSEFLPQYHQFPQKYYLNWSTDYAVKNASKIIAVSESTKKDLIKKLGCEEGKIAVVYEGTRSL